MTHGVPIAILPDIVAAVLLLAIGLWVAHVGRGRAANIGFALYAGATGMDRLLGDLWDALHDVSAEPSYLLSAGLYLVQIAGLLLMAARLPEPLGVRDRRAMAVALVVGLGIMALSATWTRLLFDAFGGGTTRFGIYSAMSGSALLGVRWGTLALLALRFRTAPEAAKPAYVLVSVALAVNPAYRAGAVLITSATTEIFPGQLLLLFAAEFLPILLLATAWTWNIPVAGALRLTKWVAWLPLASALLGMSVQAWDVAYDWGMGALRLLSFALLAYAVVRHHVLGIDVKVRWGVSRGTVAAAFVAVFFIASEGAQIVFGGGNEWVGLFAAGALVFAIAPLQRAAERLAEKAVPPVGAPAVSEGSSAGNVAAYRLAIQAAVRDDGRLTPREETHLADLAQALGVGAGDALRLRREIVADTARIGRGDP